jgi:hypothetical protein
LTRRKQPRTRTLESRGLYPPVNVKITGDPQQALQMLQATIVNPADNAPGARSRPSNPKTLAASTRVPMCLVPDTAMVELSLSFLEGYLKYGLYNWRAVGVSVMEYVSAARRHLGKFVNGQDFDPETLVPELASVMACCAIIIDAKQAGKLNDDRPLPVKVRRQLANAEKVVAHLIKLHGAKTPRHWKKKDRKEARKIGRPS